MSVTIRRYECPECGRWTLTGGFPEHYAPGTEKRCPGVPVERVYVDRQQFVDALLTDEAVMAMANRLPPNDWPDVQAHRFALAIIRAAIDHATDQAAAA